MPDAWADFDLADESDDREHRPPLAELASRLAGEPGLFARMTAAIHRVLERHDFVPEGSIVLLEGPRTWGNARPSGPEVVTRDRTRYHGGTTRLPSRGDDPYHSLPRVNRLVDRPPAEMVEPVRVERPGQGTAWIGEGDPDGPCDLCRGRIGIGSWLYCDKCHASGFDRRLVSLVVAELAREFDLEARGLVVDPESGLIVPIDADAA